MVNYRYKEKRKKGTLRCLVIAVVLWFGFRIFAPVAVSIVKSDRTMVTMRLVTPTILAMVSQSPGVNVRKMRCSARNTGGMAGSPLAVGVDL